MTQESTQERPLVTFALFAYNQEKYIREAIEGAFAQTYEPLEIILSDDCSTDRTFEIMREMASEYKGPHRVIARKTKQNRGTFNHVLEVYGEMSGQLMILSAGDDISYENRCSVIVDEWKKSGVKVLFSNFEKIGDSGESLGFDESSGGKEIMGWFSAEKRQKFNHGATTAYDRCMFEGLSYSESPIFSEDAVFYFLAHIRKYEIRKIREPLVKYRQSINSISNDSRPKIGKSDIEGFERKISWMAGSYISLCNYVLRFLSNDFEHVEIKKRVMKTRRFAVIRKEWLHRDILGRLGLILMCRDSREFRFLAPRLLGLNYFSTIKSRSVRMEKTYRS